MNFTESCYESYCRPLPGNGKIFVPRYLDPKPDADYQKYQYMLTNPKVDNTTPQEISPPIPTPDNTTPEDLTKPTTQNTTMVDNSTPIDKLPTAL